VDDNGRNFDYVHLRRGAGRLVVVFSAQIPKSTTPGRVHFKRLIELGTCLDYDWLFLCDGYGAFCNGTFYTGHKGDFFVERAMDHIISKTIWGRLDSEDVVMFGSSMGGTGALKFGLRFGVRAILAVAPVVNLDTCAQPYDQEPQVQYIIPDGDVSSPSNYRYTRQITQMLDAAEGPLPNLYVQSCEDDIVVHRDHVVPLVGRWRSRGVVELDVRPTGGHTSEHATRQLLLDVIGRWFLAAPE
jgi:pimeloyl-ACP methyl ester carboxylesterase